VENVKLQIFLKKEIWVNGLDNKRCSHKCPYVAKKQGLYHCFLFDKNVDTDTFEDDAIGYGFERTQECLDSTNGVNNNEG
jgi:hypothetical protein